jgi:hypothetical protein
MSILVTLRLKMKSVEAHPNMTRSKRTTKNSLQRSESAFKTPRRKIRRIGTQSANHRLYPLPAVLPHILHEEQTKNFQEVAQSLLVLRTRQITILHPNRWRVHILTSRPHTPTPWIQPHRFREMEAVIANNLAILRCLLAPARRRRQPLRQVKCKSMGAKVLTIPRTLSFRLFPRGRFKHRIASVEEA